MIPFRKLEKREVSDETMQDVYQRIKTPYKYGAILKYDDEMCDSPFIFRYRDKWYMNFVKIDKDTKTSGYEEHLCQSDDLLHWEYMFPVFTRSLDGSWNSRQIGGVAAFVENDLYGQYRIQDLDGYYYFCGYGGNLDGYETDPLYMGLARTDDIFQPSHYRWFDPILRPNDPDGRVGERLTHYRSHMFIDEAKTTGYSYVNAYNAKDGDHRESIYLAVSNDGIHWERYGDKYVIYDDTEDKSIRINGDAQILKYGDLYIMIYFVLQNGITYDTFACSYDLQHWKKWTGKRLIESEYDWEDLYAHKPYVLVENGVVYHYYCACNKKGERFIALATSKPLQ